MREKNTKERILDAALELFASQGYEQVSMKDIAQAVGIKAPSLYKHYSGKQEIYDSIVQRSEKTFYDFSADLGISESQDATTQGMLKNGPEAMKKIGLALFDFLLHDANTVQFRRMLAMRQYSNPDLADIYTRFYLVEPMQYQGTVAAAMLEAAGESKQDAELLGLEFYAPIFLLMTRCDIHPEFEPQAISLLERHMDYYFSGKTTEKEER